MTDRELDAKIQKEIIRPSPFPPVLDVFGHIQEEHTPFYSTSIKYAWDVAEKVGLLELAQCPNGDWDARFNDGVWCNSRKAPKAICLAALKAVGGGVKA